MAFEDSVHGIHAAKAAGLCCVATPSPITRHLALHQPDRVASGFDLLTVEPILAAAGRSGSASAPK